MKFSNIKASILGTTVSQKGEEQEKKAPLETAISALVNISGGPKEVKGYDFGDENSFLKAGNSFQIICHQVSTEIQKRYPKKVKTIVEKSPFYRKKKDADLYSNLSEDEKDSQLLAGLLTEFSFYLELRSSKFLGWDDGDLDAAMMIVYGWRKTIPRKIKLVDSSAKVHFETRKLIREALKDYPKNHWVKFVAQRYQNAWYFKNGKQLAESIQYYKNTGPLPKKKEDRLVIKALGHSSLVDLGLRYQNGDLIKEHIEALDKELKPTNEEKSMFLLAEAWGNVHNKDQPSAKSIALQLTNKQNPLFKKQGLKLLKTLGNRMPLI